MAVEHKGAERRKAIRYPVAAEAAVITKDGHTILATAVDISSAGMRLRFGGPCLLAFHQEITVEVQLPGDPDKLFSSWGLGRVAYINGNEAGIQLRGGKFDPSKPGVTP